MADYFNIRYELDPSKVLEAIDLRLRQDGGSYICVADGNILTQVHRDEEYRSVINGAMFSICDSSWVPIYLRLLYGIKAPQYCGSQIFDDIINSKKYRMAFLGASREVLDALKRNLAVIDPRIADMTFMELPFREADAFDYKGIAAEVNAEAPDIIWLALGAPKQERFASGLAPLLGRGIIIPVGAVFNFRAGLGIRRAPEWMIRCHLEFAWRIFSEPRKQLRRVWGIITTTPSTLWQEYKRKRTSRH